jgi:hypothetical protein
MERFFDNLSSAERRGLTHRLTGTLRGMPHRLGRWYAVHFRHPGLRFTLQCAR